MGGFFLFWRECLKWAFIRWEKGEPVLTQLLPLSSTYISVGFGVFSAQQIVEGGKWLWLIGWLPLVFLLFLVAPYKLWKEKQNRVAQLEDELQPKLAVFIESSEAVPGGKPPMRQQQSYFWRLGVKNMSMSPIPRCYSAILNCYRIGENGSRIIPEGVPWPREPHMLPWGRMSLGKYERDFASEETAYLDYIMIHNEKESILYVPSCPDSPEERPNYTSYPIPHDNLEFEIAVGSRSLRMKRSVIKFRFEWQGKDKAKITELDNTIPQVPDKEDSQT